jgi:4-amino-4-deoxy-L-arabinose transferase-like glycosyltransferase
VQRSKIAPLRLRDWTVLVLLISVALASAVVLVEFGTYLGFSFRRELIYPVIVMVPTIFVGFGLWLAGNSETAKRASSFLSRRGLGIVMLVSVAVRLAFLLGSSMFPDEYGIVLVLQSRPLENVPAFLAHYQAIAGNYLFIHPPLSLLLMDVGYLIVPSVYGPRLASALFSTATVLVVYYLVRDLGYPKMALLSSAVYGLVPHTALYLTLALTDGIWIFFGVTSFWLIVRALKKDSYRLSLASGVFLSLALWTKEWLPFFFFLLALVMVLLVFTKQRVWRRLGMFMTMSGLSVALFLTWGVINPVAFRHSTSAMFDQILRLLNPAEYKIGTTTPPTTGGAAFDFFSLLTSFFPKISSGTLRIISFPELIAPITLWIPLVVVLMSLAGLWLALRRNTRFGVACLVWIAVPFLLMLPYFRDLRYLIVTAPGYALLASAASIAPRSRKARLSLQSVLLASVMVSLVIMLPVSNQMYGGLQDASSQLQRLGLAEGNVLTNVPPGWLNYYLPGLHAAGFSPTDNPASVLSILRQQRIDAVVVVHNERGAWPDLDVHVLETIRGQFRGYASGGPSAFSWYELFYEPISGT